MIRAEKNNFDRVVSLANISILLNKFIFIVSVILDCWCFLFSPDARKIFVFVSYGFFVEFTLDEALKFIDKRNAFLTEHTDKLTKDVARVKANIQLVLEVMTKFLEKLFLCHRIKPCEVSVYICTV